MSKEEVKREDEVVANVKETYYEPTIKEEIKEEEPFEEQKVPKVNLLFNEYEDSKE